MIVTGQDIVDAIRKNGYRQAHDGQWIVYDDDMRVIKACAMGQAVLNLGLDLDDFKFHMSPAISSFIMDQNDTRKRSCKTIAKLIEIEFPWFLNKEFSISQRY